MRTKGYPSHLYVNTYIVTEDAEHVLRIVSPGSNVPGGEVLNLRQQFVQLGRRERRRGEQRPRDLVLLQQ